jgi:hypothetical protein
VGLLAGLTGLLVPVPALLWTLLLTEATVGAALATHLAVALVVALAFPLLLARRSPGPGPLSRRWAALLGRGRERLAEATQALVSRE